MQQNDDADRPFDIAHLFNDDERLNKVFETFESHVASNNEAPEAWLQFFRAVCLSGAGYMLAQQHAYMAWMFAFLAQRYPDWWQRFTMTVPEDVKQSEYAKQISKALGIILDSWPAFHEYDADTSENGRSDAGES